MLPTRQPKPMVHRTWICAGALAGLLAALPIGAATAPPRLLSQTGLFVAGSTDLIAPGVLSFTPQYPLWSDGSSKRRWIWLPPGKHIDARRADAWTFPIGTRLWKEFSFGQRVETRMIERLRDGSWRFVVYVWKADGSDAELAPAAGIRTLSVNAAPNGRYTVPSRDDCRACHEGGAVPVLGFSALQLSPERDPLAPHAEPRRAQDVDLPWLVQHKLLRKLPQALLDQAPRIAADSPEQRAALGYLHANCGHCHNHTQATDSGVPVELLLAQSVTRPDSAQAVLHALRQRPLADDIMQRMRARDPRTQMPPLGTQHVDTAALSLIARGLALQPNSNKESKP